LFDAVFEFFKVMVFAERGELVVGEVVVAGFRDDAIAAVAGFAGCVGEVKCGDGEVGVAREAGGEGLGCLDEAERGGMCAEKFLDGFRRGDFGSAGGGCAEEVEELVAVACREAVGGVSDDVGVNVVGQVEANGEAARVGVGLAVGDFGKAGGVGEAGGDGSGFALDVRGRSKRFRCGSGLEGSAEHKALGMGGAEAGMRTEDFVELREEVVGEGDYTFVVRQRHWGSLRSFGCGEAGAVVEKINGGEKGIREIHGFRVGLSRIPPLRQSITPRLQMRGTTRLQWGNTRKDDPGLKAVFF
jgi:hypothetical protein